MLPRTHGRGIIVLPVGYPALGNPYFPAVDILFQPDPGGAVGTRHQVRVRLNAAALHLALERPGWCKINPSGDFDIVVIAIEREPRLAVERSGCQETENKKQSVNSVHGSKRGSIL